MKYHVFWSPGAEQQLDEILKATRFGNEIAQAAREIDLQLTADPLGVGESRYGEIRVGFARPLGVEYEVFADSRTVIVHGVWRVKQF